MSIESLPTEILRSILMRLALGDLLAVASVNKQLHQHVRFLEGKWKELCMTTFQGCPAVPCDTWRHEFMRRTIVNKRRRSVKREKLRGSILVR